MKRFLLGACVIAATCGLLHAQEQGKSQDQKEPADSRLGKPKDYNGYFPWTPPKAKEEWAKRRQEVREQVLVANGLWPMPEKTPLKAVVHGLIKRDGYTIEKVYFASYPGHYVTGNLYRPTGKKGKVPAILSPHGHWANGRFYDAGDKGAMAQMKLGAEKTLEGAHYPLQARCAQLARMGCVVFHYDMVGYADSKQIPHRTGFTDAEAELRLQSFMGLQTWNSIRALDFLTSLPDVDATRIGVTGASGGGTQTFILCAVDDRPAVAVPAVMVSTAMQGGCICENCSILRVGTGNIELAALFAPKPLGLIGADDWTIDIETKGYPELQAVYNLYGARPLVQAKAFKQFKHNYNQVSREFMYNFFNQHLKLGFSGPVQEQPFQPVPPKELSVFDDKHPLPSDAVAAAGLRAYLTKESQRQLQALLPRDEAGLEAFRKTIGTALHALVTDRLPASSDVVEAGPSTVGLDEKGLIFSEHLVSRKGHGEAVPVKVVRTAACDGTMVVWVHPEGAKSLWNGNKLVPAAKQLIDKRAAIVAVDVLGTGSLAKGRDLPINKNYAGYTFGYNRPLLANRVHDILTAVSFARGLPKARQVHLVGLDRAGPWVVLARALCGDAVAKTAADLHQFNFKGIENVTDEMMLPGALKYGGLPAFTALCAPHELLVHNTKGTGVADWAQPTYGIAGQAARLQQSEGKLDTDKVVGWLVP